MYMSSNHAIVALHIALCAIVACVSCFALVTQKIRLSDYYNIELIEMKGLLL